MVSKPRSLYLTKVATTSGISATQVVQLVAQKFTRSTLPLKSEVDFVVPSSKMKEERGAGFAEVEVQKAKLAKQKKVKRRLRSLNLFIEILFYR